VKSAVYLLYFLVGVVVCLSVTLMLMLVRTGNENQLNTPSLTNDWTDSLFNCFSQIIPSCVMAFSCPCILMGQISEAVHFAPCICVCMGYSSLLFTFIIISAYHYTGLLIIWGISAVLVCLIRQQVRKYHFMRQNTFEDVAVSCFCSACALSQVVIHFIDSQDRIDGSSYLSISFDCG
jgi:Cys-rich protein (TIGR01571 family)